jgi:Ca2+-binding RTX toxin-like protein
LLLHTALYNGQRGDYTVRLLAGGRIEIRDIHGSEGVDIIDSDVEQFSFGGFTYDRHDVLLAPPMPTENDDILVGTNASEFIDGLGGNDRINAGAGNDIVHGGNGNDTIFGGDGNDTLIGDAGFDRVSGGAGDDYIIDVEGEDTAVFSGNIADYSVVQQDIHTFIVTDLRANGDGRDVLYNVHSAEFANGTVSMLELTGGPRNAVGTSGDDYMFGTSGDDRLDGGAGNDFLVGGDGNDIMIGGDGNDTLYATIGSDTLSGGAGDDIIHCGAGGNSMISGGAGHDTFQFEQGAGHSVISDFSVLEDILDLRGISNYSVVQQNSNVFITIGQNVTELVNVDLSHMSSANFLF